MIATAAECVAEAARCRVLAEKFEARVPKATDPMWSQHYAKQAEAFRIKERWLMSEAAKRLQVLES